jgi:hypothetical protein
MPSNLPPRERHITSRTLADLFDWQPAPLRGGFDHAALPSGPGAVPGLLFALKWIANPLIGITAALITPTPARLALYLSGSSG